MIRLYYQTQSSPCGPDSGCCGGVGRAEWDALEWCTTLEQEVPGVEVEVVDSLQPLDPEKDLPVINLLNTFGAAAFPIFVLDDTIISMGPPIMAELVCLVRQKHTLGRRNAKERET